MISSPTIGEIGAAIAAAQHDIEHVGKDKEVRIKTKNGATISYKYADLATLIDCVRAAFAPHGVSVLQSVKRGEQGVIVSTRLLHASGEWLEDEGVPVGVNISDPKQVGSAVTYARRYGLAAMTGIAQTDDDGQAVERNTKPASVQDAPPVVGLFEQRKQKARERVASLSVEGQEDIRLFMQSENIDGSKMTGLQLDAVEDKLAELEGKS